MRSRFCLPSRSSQAVNKSPRADLFETVCVQPSPAMSTTRRLQLLTDWLDADPSEANESWLKLKGCAAETSEHPELIPFGYESALMRSRWAQAHLQVKIQYVAALVER